MAAPAPKEPYEIRVIGAARTPLRDAYHAFLRMPWSQAIGLIVVTYLALNALFALAYLLVGGVANARPGSYADAFVFSVQTMATIGYGDMHPIAPAAHAIVIVEAVTTLLLTAIATGLVFSKFGRSRARMVFARTAVICPIDGVPHLMIRFGNERGNRIVEAEIHVDLTRTTKTEEGHTIYRILELPLVRSRAPQLARSFTVLHLIDEKSPLHGRTPAQVEAEETEVAVSVVGLDDTTIQPMYATHRYMAADVIWGARHRDVLSETPDGAMLLDLRRFHETEPTAPTPGFPYPAK